MLRLAHWRLLWSDEDYHLAAALFTLSGKVMYRDFWYDKPPLDAFYYLLVGAHPGIFLRLLDAVYIAIGSWICFRIGRRLWGDIEGCLAALLFAFYTTFYLPAAVIPFAADAVLLVPHLAAIDCAIRNRPLQSGAWIGIGLLTNAKALFVLFACLAWTFSGGAAAMFACGVAVPLAVQTALLIAGGAWNGYVEEVWIWGLVYARSSPATHVLANGAQRTANWMGFHAGAIAGVCYLRTRNWRLLAWLALSFCAVCVGGRFMPRYFLQVLPPVAVLGGAGLVRWYRMRPRTAVAAGCLLMSVPIARFGPRYARLAVDPQPHWADVQMDEDSREVADAINQRKHGGDRLFVWGYRPDMYVYARMEPPGRFWDSQPLTGVPADRHLSADKPLQFDAAAANRAELVRSRPTFIVDGLGLLNARLAPQSYPELRTWLQNYEVICRTHLSVVYRLRGGRG